jgi:hypothetical protein
MVSPSFFKEGLDLVNLRGMGIGQVVRKDSCIKRVYSRKTGAITKKEEIYMKSQG